MDLLRPPIHLHPLNSQIPLRMKRVFCSLMRMVYFWVQNGPFAPKKHFLGKIINIILIYLLANFIVPNFKSFYNRPRSIKMCHFCNQNGPVCSNQNISENLLINLVPIIHAYLHYKNQSQISIF